MPIEKILRIQNHGIFRNFHWPDNLPPFTRFNLIFAGNGTGKTTLSNLFKRFESKDDLPPSEGSALFQANHIIYPFSNLKSQDSTRVRVFNRDFVNRAVFESSNDELAPIFYFGESSVEQGKTLDSLRREAEQMASAHVRLEITVEKRERELDDFCISSARHIKSLLTTPFGRYNNFNKSDFKTAAARMRAMKTKPTFLSEAERTSLMVSKDAEIRDRISPIANAGDGLWQLKDKVVKLARTSVVAAVLEELAREPTISDWVHQGLSLHRETDICKFCGQKLPIGRLDRLQQHFNDQHSKLISEIDLVLGEVDRRLAALGSPALPPSGVFYKDEADEYKKLAIFHRVSTERITEVLESMRDALVMKRSSPFQVRDLPAELATVQPESLFMTLLSAANDAALMLFGTKSTADINALIEQHNHRVVNHSSSVETARSRLLNDEILSALTQLDLLEGRHAEATEARENNRVDALKAKEQIIQLERSMIEHKRPAEELTRELCAYIGNAELSFEASDTGYIIRRGEEFAHKLSEGECTAIAFLYFLKSLNDKDFNIREGVVVIDDPVSSLDSNALYCAFGFMQSRTKDCGQLFILTHSFSFFRLTKNWFSDINRTKPEAASFFMLRIAIGNPRSAMLAKLDPMLHSYESEYQYMFKCLLDAATAEGDDIDMATAYGIANVARRFLEGFLSFRHPDISTSLHAKLARVIFDEAKKIRLIRFLNVHSHSDHIDEPEHDLTILSETKAVLRDLLAIVEISDDEHFRNLSAKLGRKGLTFKP